MQKTIDVFIIYVAQLKQRMDLSRHWLIHVIESLLSISLAFRQKP